MSIVRTSTPTGRQRHRLYKPLFGKPLLVLQVEVENSGGMELVGGMVDHIPDTTIWVDARPEHVTIQENIPEVDHERD